MIGLTDRALLLSVVAYYEKKARQEHCKCGLKIARQLRSLVEEAAIEDLIRLLTK